MKQNIKNYLIITTSLLIFTLFIALILTILQMNQIFNYKTLIIITDSISYLLLAVFSFILGLKMKKRGILNGIVFSLIFLFITLTIGDGLSDMISIIKFVTKSLVIILFSVLGVNKK